jgi:3'-phosphoadenosine 5'-phosphosulfate sulfotransferase (PAPS reductase)/FAD synthetase
MRDPFEIDGPGVISFSGGRTSGYMLWRILQANGGTLPDGVVSVFANTGKEMPETLDFVKECSERWAVPITWVEYAGRNEDGSKAHRIVTHETASRNGEPFLELIKDRSFLPNPVARFCTVELKIRTMHRYLRSIGFTEWTSYIGLRADEQRRVAKIGNQDYGKHETKEAPLARAGIAVAEVGQFWTAQPFDLMLPNMNGVTMHGNCDLCYLKGLNQKVTLIREKPERAIWWIAAEASVQSSGQATGDGARFRKDQPSYQQMYDMAVNHGELFPFDDEPLADCACTD